MRILFLGNFSVPYTSETHHAKSLGELGHQVQCLQETKTTPGQISRASRVADLCVWGHTHGWHTHAIEAEFASALRRGVPVITYHLDLWHGLHREKDMETDPYWSVLTDFFTCDRLMADHLNANTKIRGHYLPPGVFGQECQVVPPTQRFDVCFVGSKKYHAEWPYRPHLIDWLTQTYGGNFRLYGQDGLGVVRGEELNQVYANAKVVVGDSLCLGYDYPYYHSDRVPETLGRGGFLIHPRIKGLDELYGDGKHLVLYTYNDFPELRRLIGYYLRHDEEREAIRRAGHEHVVANHTYVHRWKHILETLGMS